MVSQMNCRSGEIEKTWFRSSRFFYVGEEVFFSTREGNDIGPYKNIDAAKKGLNMYIEAMQQKDKSGLYASKIALQGVWASTLFH